MRLLLLLLGLAVHLAAATAPTTQSVNLQITGATTTGGTITYAWSVVSRPTGADGAVPSFGSTATTTSGTNTAVFPTTAAPGTYLIQATLTSSVTGVTPVILQTPIQVTQRQTTTFGTGPATITYTPITGLGYMELDPAATTNAPAPLNKVTYTIVSSTITPAPVVAGNRIQVRGTGTVTVRADIEAHTPVLYRSNPVQKTFTFTAPSVTRQAQTITLASPATLAVVMGTTNPQITASASSGLALSYASSNTGIATVSAAGAITVVGPGTATITISQAGNDTYLPATSTTVTITVTRPVITATSLTASPATLELP